MGKDSTIGVKNRAFLPGAESKKQRHIRAWMCFQAGKVVGYPRL
jgi:hypothetical protein